MAVKPTRLTFDPNVAPYQRPLLLTILGFDGKAFPSTAPDSRAKSYRAKLNQATTGKTLSLSSCHLFFKKKPTLQFSSFYFLNLCRANSIFSSTSPPRFVPMTLVDIAVINEQELGCLHWGRLFHALLKHGCLPSPDPPYLPLTIANHTAPKHGFL